MNNLETQTSVRAPLPDEVFVEGGLERLMERDFSADLLLPEPMLDLEEESDGGPTDTRSPELIELLRLPKNGASSEVGELVSEELSELRALREQRLQELQRMRTLLAGDAHGLSDEEIDSMSVEELLQVDRVGGSIHNLKSANDYDKEANSFGSRVSNGFGNFFTGYGMFGEYIDQPKVAEEQRKHSLAIVEDYKEKIAELKSSIENADKDILTATQAETSRISAAQQLLTARESGDPQAVQRARLQVERNTLKIERTLNSARRRLHARVEIDYRRHQRGFKKLNEMFAQLDKAYGQADANRKLVQKVVIITVAATATTLLSGGAAGAFWVPFLAGTAVGGVASFLSAAGEQAIAGAMGLKTDWPGAMKGAAWNTVDCALTCVGAGWAAASTKVVAATASKTALARLGSFISRNSLGMRMAFKSQLPSTAFYTASDIRTWYNDPTGKSGMDPRKVTEWGAKVGEVMLSTLGGGVGHHLSGLRTHMARSASKNLFGAASRNLGKLSTYAADLLYNVGSTKAEIMMAQALTGRKFTQDEINQRYLATWTGWGVGVGTERVQDQVDMLGKNVVETASKRFRSVRERAREHSGVGGSADSVVEGATGALPKDLIDHDFDPATGHRDLKAAEMQNLHEEYTSFEDVTGRPIRETVAEEIASLDRVFRRKSGASKRLQEAAEKSLLRLASEEIATSDHKGDAETVKGLVDRLDGAADSMKEQTTRRFERYRSGQGQDKWIVTEIVAKADKVATWFANKVVDPVSEYSSTAVKNLLNPEVPAADASRFAKASYPAKLAGSAFLNYMGNQFVYRAVVQPTLSFARDVSIDGCAIARPNCAHSVCLQWRFNSG